MLQNIDLSRKVTKEAFKKESEPLAIRLGELQRAIRNAGVPSIFVFEGWDAAGKGTLINAMIQPLDPRGFEVIGGALPPTEDEAMRPFFWRYWRKTPAAGRIVIWDRSWHYAAIEARVAKKKKTAALQEQIEDILSFERQLADAGVVILKFFLHISKKEQNKRLQKLEDNPATRWRVKKEDWERHKQYDRYLQATEEVLAQTDAGTAPWIVIEATDARFATLKIFHAVIQAWEDKLASIANVLPPAPAIPEKKIEAKKEKGSKSPPPKEEIPPPPTAETILVPSYLDRLDMSLTLDPEEYRVRMKKAQERLRELEYAIYKARIPVVILFEGWDAAGKGGAIRRLTENLDPRGYKVIPIAAPNDLERAHHYLWRFWNEIPKAGHIAIFDRTWYGRVLVERVEGFCPPEAWRRAYREINEMESQLLEAGTALFKFWLHITPEEQLRRFRARESTPYKQWKITDEDWRNREKWPLYKTAVEEMLFRTSTTDRPWTVVEADSKLYARVKIVETVVGGLEKALRKRERR